MESIKLSMKDSTNSEYIYTTARKRVNSEDYYSNINTAIALGKTHVPLKHKQLASNYVLIKRIFGSSCASIQITNADRTTLTRHGFLTLENTSISAMNRQIEQLKAWANSGDILLCAYSNELFEIRIKELKYLRLTVTKGRSPEFKEGYKALEKYVEYIAR